MTVYVVSLQDVLNSQGKKGGFKDTHPEELLAAVLKEVVSRGKVDVNLIE